MHSLPAGAVSPFLGATGDRSKSPLTNRPSQKIAGFRPCGGKPAAEGSTCYQKDNRSANCSWREKFACAVIFPKLLLPNETLGP